jgi:hypothetical protein
MVERRMMAMMMMLESRKSERRVTYRVLRGVEESFG